MTQETDRWSPWLAKLDVSREQLSDMYRAWYRDVLAATKEEMEERGEEGWRDGESKPSST